MKELHPLTHILICLVFSSMVFAMGNLLQLLLITIFSIAYASLRIKGGLKAACFSVYRSLFLVLSLAIIQLIFNRHGSIFWQWGWLRITSMGLYWAVVFALRLFTVVICGKALAALSFPQFQAAFASLRLPEEFSFMLSYGVQLVPMFLARIKGFVAALRLRGIEINKLSIKQRIHLYQLLAISALAAVIQGSSYAAIALELRGFRSKGQRSYLHESKLKLGDGLALLILLFGMAIILGIGLV